MKGYNLAIHRALYDANPEDVLVINALGGTTRAVFGDLAAEICLAVGTPESSSKDGRGIELLSKLWGYRCGREACHLLVQGKMAQGPCSLPWPVVEWLYPPVTGSSPTTMELLSCPPGRADAVLDGLRVIDKFEDELRARIRTSFNNMDLSQ